MSRLFGRECQVRCVTFLAMRACGLPAPGIKDVVDQGQGVLFVGEFEGVPDHFSAGVLLVDLVGKGRVVFAGRGGAGIDAGGAVGGELSHDGFADGLGCASDDTDEAILYTSLGFPTSVHMVSVHVRACRRIGKARCAGSRQPPVVRS